MLFGDAREEWDGNVMPDTRVIHFWDDDAMTGQWFAKEIEGYQGVSWDVYYLYGPDATWEDVPSPLIGAGVTIYDKREKLRMEFSSVVDEVR